MSEGHNNDNLETLFSFELLVEYIRIERDTNVSDELALGVRLLDFPTLLIYQPQHRTGDINQPEKHEEDKRRQFAFHRGKSCFFKMNLNSLHTHLSNTPLYAMVLDVKEEIPKLVGSSLISLAKVMDRIRQDVTEHGVSAPSSHGERGLVGMCSLTGEKIGSIFLSYKLLSLGASLLPHITDRMDIKSTRLHGGQHVQEGIKEGNISTESVPLDCVNSPTLDKSDASRNTQNKGPANTKILISEDNQDNAIEHRPRTQVPQTVQDTENYFEEDLTVFCPPHLYYRNSAEEKSKNEGGDYKLLTLDSEAFTFEDSCSEDEMAENKSDGPGSPTTDQRMRKDAKTLRNQETSGASPNVLGEALRQLPLLNALLVELSQLNGQNPQQPLSIHPSLAWIYRPASAEPSAEHRDTPRKTLQKTRQRTSPHFKHLHPPRNCSTPIARPTSVHKKDKQEEALTESKSSSKSPGKKLVYGTTKTFNLRLKQVSPLKVKRHECMELIQNETRADKAKSKAKNKIIKSSNKKSVLNQSSSLDENIETMIQGITVDGALQETTSLKQKNPHGKVHDKQDSDSPRISEKLSSSERRDLKCIHIPSVSSDSASQNKDKSERHSESNLSRSESDRHREKIESSGSSRQSSRKSSFSDSSREGNEEADYADDFNSLEPSDAYSPDPMSSPEPSRPKTPKSPVRPDLCTSDSGSESVQRRAHLPVPVKAPSSPQRTLRGTHIIRPRTHASAISFSSDDGDRDRSAPLQIICSRKQMMTESGRVERSSGAESFISSRGHRSESTRNSGTVQGFSQESVSSFEPQEAEELEDELGSLDFRKEYQHISELVANKLPGYTM
ncbi:microtubule-associated protein 10 [Lates calcarifer]|uniref:Microtubule-associated protein 10 n=1 Tax=Lates calcarifer TaxID=8187 RepID=A0A4W6C7S8_LATCA|nr:microtubule-associated protein 10 [Lates calcarifer]